MRCRTPLAESRRHQQPVHIIFFRGGISAVEVTVIVAVLGLLAAIVAPLLLRTRESARASRCENNLRALMVGMQAYHDTHTTFPPAAVWSTDATHSLALHRAKRIEQITHENWAQLLLPFVGHSSLSGKFDPALPIGDSQNETGRTTSLAPMSCPSDEFNHSKNPYRIQLGQTQDDSIELARGNYAINAGSQNLDLLPPSTAHSRGDLPHLVMQEQPRHFALWGNGVAGINKAFSLDDFANGPSTLVALEEVRAGIHPLDPRGVWALGQIGGSITWGHGVNGDAFGPNNQWPRSDDVLGCGTLHEILGSETLLRERMPCVHYVDANQQASARSLHPGGVHCAFVDGSVRFISDNIDPGLWHVMHSRETPADVLATEFGQRLTVTDFTGEAPQPVPSESESKSNSRPESYVNSVGMEFVKIPAGEFEMGVPDIGNSSVPENCPVHQVRITSPFLLAAREVTRTQFRKIMGEDDGGSHEVTSDDLPLTGVTWNDAALFCKRLSELPSEKTAGRRYRLPTEAEWEYACRGGTSQPYVWKSRRQPGDQSGEAAGIDPPLPLTPVGSYPPNEFGLYDMRGNAWEWTADWFDRDYYMRSPVEDPQGPSVGYLKVVRGSDWRFIGEPCLIDYPMLPPWKGNPFVGFRVVCVVSGQGTSSSEVE